MAKVRKLATTPPPATDEVAIANTQLWPLQEFAPYNPDDLVGKKGLGIYDDMRRDDQVKACLELKKLSILGPGWQVVAGGERRKDKKAADFVEWALDQLPGTFDEILYGMLTFLEYGFSVTERVAVTATEGRWHDFNVIGALKVRAPYDIDFEADEFGNLKALKQGGRLGGERKLDPRRFIILVHQQRFSNWYGESDLRAAHKPWWVKQQVVKFWAMYLERFGMPTVKGTYPRGTSAAEQAKYKKIVEKLQAATAMVVPAGLELDFIEAARGGGDAFEKAMNRLDLAIAKSLLVPNLLGLAGGEPETGSFARSQTSFDVYMLVIEGLRTKLQEAVNEQVIAPLHEWNFGPTVEPPRFEFLPLSEENKQAISKEWTAAVVGGAVTPTPEDENYQRQLLGFPERDIPSPEERQQQQVPAEPPPQNGAPPDSVDGTVVGSGKPGDPIVIDVQSVPPGSKAVAVRRRLLEAFRSGRYSEDAPVEVRGLR